MDARRRFRGRVLLFRPHSDRVSAGLRTRGVQHDPASQALQAGCYEIFLIPRGHDDAGPESWIRW